MKSYTKAKTECIGETFLIKIFLLRLIEYRTKQGAFIMKNCTKTTRKCVFTSLLFSAAVVLHVHAAKADVAASPSSLNLPPEYSWSNPQSAADTNSADAAAALQSLTEAQAYSPLYNPAWFYDLEIFYDTNLMPPSGNYIGTGQAGGTGSPGPVIETLPGGSTSTPVDPLQALAAAQAYSPSYNSTWVSDVALFLNRDSSGGSTTPTNVPEPGSLAIFGTGILGLGLIMLKRRSKKNR